MNKTERDIVHCWLTLIIVSLLMLLLGAWYSWDVARFVASLSQAPEGVVFYKGLQYLPGIVVALTVVVCFLAYRLFVRAAASRLLRYGTNAGIFLGLMVFLGWPQLTAGKVHQALQLQGYSYCEAVSGQWSSMLAQVYVQGSGPCPLSLDGM